MNEQVFLIRNEKQQNPDIQTLGTLNYKGKQIAVTLELPWKGNQNRISCIPKGAYKVLRRYSPKYNNHFHVTNVPGRSYILIHHANYYYDLLGCIGVGQNYAFINKDAILDITSSRQTMKKLLKDLPDSFDLIIQ